MCPECFRLPSEHTMRERRACDGRPATRPVPEDLGGAPLSSKAKSLSPREHHHPVAERVAISLSLEDIRAVVAETLPDEHPDSDMSRAGILLLSAFQVGPINTALRAFTGLPWTVINNGSFYARHTGIWQGRGRQLMIVCEWEQPDHLGYIAFVADCLVVAGRIFRTTDFDEHGHPVVRYRARTLGDYSATLIEGADEIPWDDVARPDERERRRLARAGTP